MRFREIRPFSGAAEDVVRYLSREVYAAFKDLFHGLRKLTFADNFEAFEWEGDIAAGGVATIKNQLGGVPSRWFTVWNSAGVGIGNAAGADYEWRPDLVYLQNYGATAARVKVIFMR